MAEVFAFACRISWWHDQSHYTIVNELTPGRANARFLRDVSDPWPNTKYTDILVRKVGAAHTSERFRQNAFYRGIPDARCGDAVKVGDDEGVIVGHNSSANLDILFTSGKWEGQTLNVHPQDVRLATPSTGTHHG